MTYNYTGSHPTEPQACTNHSPRSSSAAFPRLTLSLPRPWLPWQDTRLGQAEGSTPVCREVSAILSISALSCPVQHSCIPLPELNFSLNFFISFDFRGGQLYPSQKLNNSPPPLGVTPMQMLVQGFTSSSALGQHLAKLCSLAKQSLHLLSTLSLPATPSTWLL